MAEIQKETEELIDRINTARKETLDAYSQGLKNLVSAPMEKTWEEGIESVEEIIRQSIKAQNEVGAALLEKAEKMDGLPEEALELVGQLHEMNKIVYTAQQDVLKACLEVVKALDPAKLAGSTGSLVALPVATLKSAMSRAIDINMRLLSGVSKQLDEPKKAPRKSAAAKAAIKQD